MKIGQLVFCLGGAVAALAIVVAFYQQDGPVMASFVAGLFIMFGGYVIVRARS